MSIAASTTRIGRGLRAVLASSVLIGVASIASAGIDAIPYGAIPAGTIMRYGPFDNAAGVDKEFEYMNSLTRIFVNGTNVRIRFLWNGNANAALPNTVSQWINFNNLAANAVPQGMILDTGGWLLQGACPRTVWLEIHAVNNSIDTGGDYRHDCVGDGNGTGTAITPEVEAPALPCWWIATLVLAALGLGSLLLPRRT